MIDDAEGVAFVPLTRGYVAIVDAADVEFVMQWKWNAKVEPSGQIYARRMSTGARRRCVYLHRALMGEPAGIEVDHKDGNGLNNRRNNLRKATHQQQMSNLPKSSANKSGYRGVHWDASKGKWIASIRHERRRFTLGRFRSAEEAHQAYVNASQQMRGEFARQA